MVSTTFSLASLTAGTSRSGCPLTETRQASAPRFTTTSSTPAAWVRAITSSNRFFSPQRVFIIEGQKRDIGAGEHLLIDLLRFRLAGPQARTIVVVEDHLAAVGAATHAAA
ncbi:Uncharacterised protein [Klebsiella pneumoniae]|uniref:Uncharacterized protein n=1 Tax=Klebsiella pneumoniae TaxID=573 RepID=A0A2X3C1B4_KLEPN|nr:Uncharacterised protein [Klebsiella pneumoniae]